MPIICASSGSYTSFCWDYKIELREIMRAKEKLNFKPVRPDVTSFNIKLVGVPASADHSTSKAY